MANSRSKRRRMPPWVRWMVIGVTSCATLTLVPVVAHFGLGWSDPDWLFAPLFPGLLVSWGLIHGDSGTQFQLVRDMIIFALLINCATGGLIGLTLRAIVAGPKWMRTRRRMRNNECLACGYSKVGLIGTTCPECGTARIETPSWRDHECI